MPTVRAHPTAADGGASSSSSSSPLRSPTPRSPAFASLSRMRFTRATVAAIVRLLQSGATPTGWSRARAWRLRQQVASIRWRMRTAADASSSPGSRSSVSAGSGGDGVVLEALLPDPSADGRASASAAPVWLRVLPEEDVEAALHELYVDPAQGGLRGARALYERALTRYVGVSMQAVADFLRKQETRQAVLSKQGYLIVQPSDVDDVGHWQADLTDVSLFTASAAKHLLVCVDAFSKFAWAVPLDSKHATNIASALERLFLQEGPPLILRTDGGSDMANAPVAALCARYAVDRRVCAPYNSQCNGGIERLHRTLKETMARHTHEWLTPDGTVDWVRLLPLVLYSYNTTVHRTTGFTPFLLQRGRAPRPLGALQLQPRSGAALAGPALYAADAGGGAGAASCTLPCSSAAASAPGAPAATAAFTLRAASPPVAPVASKPVEAGGAAAARRRPGPSAGSRGPSGTAGASAVGPRPPGGSEPAYTISRVLATRRDPVRREMRYWVRWAGFAPAADSWITAPMAGASERQFDLWIRRTHKAYPPAALEGPFITPRGRERLDVPVTAEDRAALAAQVGVAGA